MKRIPAVTKTVLEEPKDNIIRVGDMVNIVDFSFILQLQRKDGLDIWSKHYPIVSCKEIGLLKVIEMNLRMPSPEYNKGNRRMTPEYLDTMVQDGDENSFMTKVKFLRKPSVEKTIVVKPEQIVLEAGDHAFWRDYSYSMRMTDDGKCHGAWARDNAIFIVGKQTNCNPVVEIVQTGLKMVAIDYGGDIETDREGIVYLDTMVKDDEGHYWMTMARSLSFAS